MAIRRIVADLKTDDPAGLAAFYQAIFGCKTVMDMGFVCTVEAPGQTGPVQITMASEGGSGTPVPHLSIEVDDLDDCLARAQAQGLSPEYGPVTEPWGVRRFFLRDPAGHLLNILTHA